MTWTIATAVLLVGVALTPESSGAENAPGAANAHEIDESRPIEEIVVTGRRPVTCRLSKRIRSPARTPECGRGWPLRRRFPHIAMVEATDTR